MTEFIVYFVLTAPTWSEAFIFDPIYWNKGRSDKPATTYLRGVLFITSALIVDYGMLYSHWYYALAVTFTFHVLAFALFINAELHRPIDYLGKDKYDQWVKKFPLWIRLSVAGVIFIVSVLLLELFKY